MLGKRFLTAIVAGPLVVALVLWGPPWGFPAFINAACAVGLWELLRMTLPGDDVATVRNGSLVLALGWTVMASALPGYHAIAGLAAVAAAILLLNLFRPEPIEGAAGRIGASLGALLYLALPMAHMSWLHGLADGDGWRWVMLAFLIIWVGDTTAYFGGRSIGGPKLYPKVSPGKTMSGAVTGLAGSVGAAFLAGAWFMPALTTTDAVLLGIGAGALGQMGDLTESLIKRSAGVKESGGIFPGHGGLLDRIDALIFATPLIYWYALWVAPLGG